MTPWRKHRYMEAKWLRRPERILPAGAGEGPPEKQPKFRASMLTIHFATEPRWKSCNGS
jgi:hypothetical protein